MRSRQINFFLTAEDQATLLARLMDRLGPFLFISRRSENDAPQQLDTAAVKKMGSEPLTIYLLRQKDLGQVRFEPFTEQQCYVVDSLLSPVIEFSRCYHSDGLLRRGRMYVVSSYYDRDGVPVSKDRDFLDWAAAMIAAARKIVQRRVPPSMFYCGQNAFELSQQGERFVTD
ncbi:hypothetical protein [Bradyrhizobium sp. STM 3557]|uniref:hypothetical protein n=1 Tax=Bradyrhizobium sp. STM 3557 TaxID=578920 RepID=UPI00388DE43E